MKTPHSSAELTERIDKLDTEAAGHKKAARYHRRRLRECLSQKEKYEKKLAEYGIKLEIQKKSL